LTAVPQAWGSCRGLLSARGKTETPEETIDRLHARVQELEAETTKLTTEREIMRSAANSLAGEPNWSR
jgi:outer membrane murein-binding lipoprotein Lpp